jgi:hypothetical protein
MLLGRAHVRSDFAILSGRNIATLQEYRQDLITEAGAIHRDLKSIGRLLWSCAFGLSFCGTTADIELTKSSAAELGVSSEMGGVALNSCYGSVLHEFVGQSVGAFALIHILLENLLLIRTAVRGIDSELSAFRSSACFLAIFCSVLWEKRRWFLLHGARPPKRNEQAMWARFSGVCSEPNLA